MSRRGIKRGYDPEQDHSEPRGSGRGLMFLRGFVRPGNYGSIHLPFILPPNLRTPVRATVRSLKIGYHSVSMPDPQISGRLLYRPKFSKPTELPLGDISSLKPAELVKVFNEAVDSKPIFKSMRHAPLLGYSAAGGEFTLTMPPKSTLMVKDYKEEPDNKMGFFGYLGLDQESSMVISNVDNRVIRIKTPPRRAVAPTLNVVESPQMTIDEQRVEYHNDRNPGEEAVELDPNVTLHFMEDRFARLSLEEVSEVSMQVLAEADRSSLKDILNMMLEELLAKLNLPAGSLVATDGAIKRGSEKVYDSVVLTLSPSAASLLRANRRTMNFHLDRRSGEIKFIDSPYVNLGLDNLHPITVVGQGSVATFIDGFGMAGLVGYWPYAGSPTAVDEFTINERSGQLHFTVLDGKLQSYEPRCNLAVDMIVQVHDGPFNSLLH